MVAKKNMKFEPVEINEEVAPTSVVEDVIKGENVFETIETVNITDVDNPAFDEKAAMLAFYEEPVSINIHTTHNPTAEQVFSVGVNGRQWIFKRGENYTVPRKVVEGLLRARPVHYANEEYRLEDGSQAVRNPSRTGLRYGFQVMRDENPLGGPWLTAIMAQP